MPEVPRRSDQQRRTGRIDRGSHLAVLRYDNVRSLPNPRATVLDFYESAYQAGARRAGWDVDRYACPGGITDPHASAQPATR